MENIYNTDLGNQRQKYLIIGLQQLGALDDSKLMTRKKYNILASLINNSKILQKAQMKVLTQLEKQIKNINVIEFLFALI